MSLMISIRAAQDGWSVQGDTFENGMMFRSGAEAESAARALVVPSSRESMKAMGAIIRRALSQPW